jgi:hypothetical protein
MLWILCIAEAGYSEGIASFIPFGGCCMACSIAVLVEAVITRDIL